MLLSLKDLKIYFYTSDGEVRAVDGLSYELKSGETLGLVGESGCGKTVSALSILQLIQQPPGRIIGGKIIFDGDDLLRYTPAQIRKVRGKKISMIFQEPMTSLNPLFTIGNQISEMLRLHEGLSRKDALDRSIEMLRLVHIPSPEKRVHEYPHLLSGGMRQRVMIAIALSCNPKVLIADEPTTALDVTIQAQILDLMLRLKDEMRTSIILITHDLGIIAETAQRVVVIYSGRVMEKGDVERIFRNPSHPYTIGLLNSLPRLHRNKKKRLHEIPGIRPTYSDISTGCRFYPRCPHVMNICKEHEPDLIELEDGQWMRCWLTS